MDLNDIAVFVRVVQNGSFTAAGRIFGRSPAYMSKHVAQLEAALGVTLLHRSTHRVFLTDAGAVFFDRCLTIVGELDTARTEAGGLARDLSGRLRIHTTTGVGQALVVPAVAAFGGVCPDVRVELTFSVYSASLIDRGADVLIASRDTMEDDFAHTGLYERKIGAVPYVICAAPSYLEKCAAPARPEDLADCNCLIHKKQSGNPQEWAVEGQEGLRVIAVNGHFQSNLESAVRLAALHGVGIARLPAYSVVRELESGKLVKLFDGGRSPTRWVRALYPRSRFVPKKVRVFLDILSEEFSQSGEGSRDGPS